MSSQLYKDSIRPPPHRSFICLSLWLFCSCFPPDRVLLFRTHFPTDSTASVCVLCWSNSQTTVALAVMWSQWRLTIVCPKSIFVVAQPFRTGSGQRPDPRRTQHTVFSASSQPQFFPPHRGRCQKTKIHHLFGIKSFLFELHAEMQMLRISACKTTNCTLSEVCFYCIHKVYYKFEEVYVS